MSAETTNIFFYTIVIDVIYGLFNIFENVMRNVPGFLNISELIFFSLLNIVSREIY